MVAMFSCISLSLCCSQPDPQSYVMVFGRYNKFREQNTEQTRDIARYVTYPNITAKSAAAGVEYEDKNDFTLVKLNAPVAITDSVRPICLPEVGELLPIGFECYVAGWGETRGTGHSAVLKQLRMFVKEDKVCAPRDPNGEEFVKESMYCASSDAHGQSTCGGDSGSPLGRLR